MALLERKISTDKETRVIKNLRYDGSTMVEANSFSSGILCLWSKPKDDVVPIITYVQFMHLRVKVSSLD